MNYKEPLRYSIFLFQACLTLFIVSCQTYNTTFPFSAADHASVISFSNRTMWDTTHTDEGIMINKEIVANGRIRIREDKIHDRVVLKNRDLKTLFHLLYKETCVEHAVADCYSPRHAFIFYDKQNNLIGAIEICLECRNSQVTKNIPAVSLCETQVNKLTAFLKEKGVKYFGEN